MPAKCGQVRDRSPGARWRGRCSVLRDMKRSTLSIFSLCLISSVAYAAIDDGGDGGGGGGGGGGSGSGTSGPTTISRSFSYAPTWGRPDWGANIYAGGNVHAVAAETAQGRDKLSASAVLNGNVVLNGRQYRLAGARATTNIENGRSSTLFVAASVLQADIWTYSRTSTMRSNVVHAINEAWSPTFFDQRLSLWVGPVPMTFRAQATGTLGAKLDASINVTRFAATFTPKAGASFYGSAAVGGEYCFVIGCVGASAGVSATLNLFTVSVPTRLEVAATPVNNAAGLQIAERLRSDIDITSLDGHLDVFAEAHLGGLSADWHDTLVTWTGARAIFNLIDVAASGCLTGDCSVFIPIDLPIGR